MSSSNLVLEGSHQSTSTIPHSFSESEVNNMSNADDISIDSAEFDNTVVALDQLTLGTTPLDNLTTKQQETLEKFREMLEKERSKLTPLQTYYCFEDKYCFVRYLKARDFDIQKAFNLLKSTLTWLESPYKPYNLTAKQLWLEASPAKTYIKGVDKAGRPIIYLHAGRDFTKDPVTGLYLLVYNLIAASYRMGAGGTQMTWICDFSSYTTSSAPPLGVCKQAVEILSSHFPERLGLCLMVFAPKVFYWFYKLISPLIPPVTKQKIQFCKSTKPKEMRAFFEPFVEVSQLEKKYGGDQEFKYDHNEMWSKEVEHDLKRIQIIKDAGGMKAEDADTLLTEPTIDTMDKHVKFFKARHASK